LKYVQLIFPGRRKILGRKAPPGYGPGCYTLTFSDMLLWAKRPKINYVQTWVSEGFFPGGTKSGEICFFPLKTKKDNLFF